MPKDMMFSLHIAPIGSLSYIHSKVSHPPSKGASRTVKLKTRQITQDPKPKRAMNEESPKDKTHGWRTTAKEGHV